MFDKTSNIHDIGNYRIRRKRSVFPMGLFFQHQRVRRYAYRKPPGILDLNSVIIDGDSDSGNFMPPVHVTVSVDDTLTQRIVWNFKLILADNAVMCRA